MSLLNILKKIILCLLIGLLVYSSFSFIACRDNLTNVRLEQEENDPNKDPRSEN